MSGPRELKIQIQSAGSRSGREGIPAKTGARRDSRTSGNGQSNSQSAIRNSQWLSVIGAAHNNLKNIDVHIPLGRFVCITGVSGSGKSSLVNDILREQLAHDLNEVENTHPGKHQTTRGQEQLDKIIDIDQSPIGRTPRSNPATYIKVFDLIRDLYAQLPDSKVRGYKPGRFSFNVPAAGGTPAPHRRAAGGGRCEACEGNGSTRVEMDFLADVWVTCPVCSGRRFNRETLQVLFKTRSIADVLDMDVQEALTHFENIPRIRAMLQTLHDVGLDYIKLGQSSTTLSGGEAQRIKLARELVKKSTGRTLYTLDEPTTGLHFEDIRRLLAVLHGFVDVGNTVVVIEHNLDVIKTADWIIDLGPEGGEAGGYIVAEGTPEEVAAVENSFTGQALRAVLGWNGKRVAQRRKGAKKRAYGANGEAVREITVVGARQHNLKDITVSIPREKTTVCCGPSGSGKSSFALDTVYTEGQRRYVESLSAYARQFLGQLQKPKVDHVYGLSPAISIEQKAASKSPRSTVGTVTEIYDYLRVLWARIGTPYCPTCRVPVGSTTSDEMVERILALGEGMKALLLAPIERAGSETYAELLARERANGYLRVRIDGELRDLDQQVAIDHRRRHEVDIVVDRISVKRSAAGRIADSVEQCLSVGNGVMKVTLADQSASKELRFSQLHSCSQCGTSYEELTPHHFSFNSRLGWCETCEGLGMQRGAGMATVIQRPGAALLDGAVAGWDQVRADSPLGKLMTLTAARLGIDPHAPWHTLPERAKVAFLHGTSAGETPAPQHGDNWIEAGSVAPGLRVRWNGYFPAVDRATRVSWQFRQRLEDLVTDVPCQACDGSRLKREPRCARIDERTLPEVCALPLNEALGFFKALKLDARRKRIAGELLHEVRARLTFLVDVGLEYLTLERSAPTLSGGESQRIRLASQIGSGLTGVLYVLDEPTIGLHPRDNGRLIKALNKLRDLGNTLLIVEHDREVIGNADHVLDFGPGAGADGGRIVAAATPRKLRGAKESLTGKYLSGRAAIIVPSNRRSIEAQGFRVQGSGFSHSREGIPAEVGARRDSRTSRQARQEPRPPGPRVPEPRAPDWLVVHGARQNNLKGIDVAFPLGRFTVVTGVSGSGKSSLVSDILYNALAARIHRARLVPGAHDRISGLEFVDKVINVDQEPIGNTPSSNPATYTGVFDLMRELFARLPEAKVRGYTVNRFSFNRPGGRCEACEGNGERCIEMHFLPDVWITCEACGGTRYLRETLEVKYKGKSIADILALRVSAALEHFANVPKIRRMLQTLDDVGLGYLPLGQSAPTLSGGEAQRVKLAAELGRPSTGKTVYLLDEPTTGLHFDDLRKLLAVLQRLVDLGNTVICIEHNLDIIKSADWLIDLGPEAGDGGGDIVAAGTPEAVAAYAASHTGRALAPILTAGPVRERAAFDPASQMQIEAELAAPPRPEPSEASGRLPWETDGRRWHTIDRKTSAGQAVKWSGELLRQIVQAVEQLGEFAPTDWHHRTRIEIKAPGSTTPWFCHILTGWRWVFDMTIRVPAGTFDEDELTRSLGIKNFDERTDLPVYGQWSRVRVRRTRAFDDVRLFICDDKDIRPAAFDRFLRSAARAYFAALEALRSDPATLEPWKVDGQKWHLAQKSINSRATKGWKPTTLLEMIGRVKKCYPQATIDWNHKSCVTILHPGTHETLLKMVTNVASELRVELYTPLGLLTPTQIDRLGQRCAKQARSGGEVISFWIRELTDNDPLQLAEIVNKCVAATDRVEAQVS
ncbi:MAG TPA: ATP-binding cassette domain-containing protein [Phycisphaerae bacterium]|jgi:excinuclease ABC subunit A